MEQLRADTIKTNETNAVENVKALSTFMFEILSSVEEYAFEIQEDMSFFIRMTIYVE